MKNTITEKRNTLEGISSGINEAEKWISVVENSVVEIIVTEQKKEKNYEKKGNHFKRPLRQCQAY